MDLRRNSGNASGHKVPLSITSSLVSAVLEWMLMFMIFVDASFAYLVTRFARHYQLPTPCLLCSRLDRVLGNERGGFYWDLICHDHKSKISSFVLSRLHNNLDNEQTTPDECCNEQWISRTCSQKLLQRKSIDNEQANSDAPSSVNHTDSGDVVPGFAEKSSQLDQMRSKDADPLPHVEYSQIKDTSDTESESPFSVIESAAALIHEMETPHQDSVSEFISAELTCSPNPEKLIHSSIKSSLSESEKLTYSRVESKPPLGHGLEELDWQKAGHSKDVVRPSELIDSSYIHPSPNTDGTHSDDTKRTKDATSTVELEKDVHVECRETSNVGISSTVTNELWKEFRTECEEKSRVGSNLSPPNEIQMDLKHNKTETSSQMIGSLDLGDAYRLAVGARGRQLSGRLEQQRSITDRVSEDLKLLLSQISAARGPDLSSNDMSPKVSANIEDFKAVDASGAIGTQIFQRRISLERNESNLSLDGSIVGEIEGENDVDQLKRQVQHDKKIFATLYKELEEERNASAIAANQAMAMITRLQEEKAAFHMEALQCVRMMEEQAEYEGEALQNANVLLAEKEKLIQNIQLELDFYRNRSGDVPSSNDFVEQGPESESYEMKERILEANCRYTYTAGFSDSDSNKHEIVKKVDGAPKMLNRDMNTLQISLHQFEDEKQYVLECLKTVEEKLLRFTNNEVYSDMIVGGFSTEESLEESASDQPEFVGSSQENSGTEKDHLKRESFMPKDVSGYENSQHENEDYGKLRSGKYESKDVELAALRQELSDITNRLQAVEAEQNVIEYSINALEKGSEGYEFIREIAARLHELHSAHVMKRKEDST